jgi:hypothetical protein
MTNNDVVWWRWGRDLIFIPLIIGLVIVSIQFGIPKILERNMELSYSIEDPIIYIEPQTIGNLVVEINGEQTSSLYAYKVRIWNSGDLPIKNLPIRFVFDRTESDFKIFSVAHDTKPKYEFGEIVEQGNDTHSKRFIYSLLNSNDEDVVTFLTNYPASLSVYAKLEGLSVKLVKPNELILGLTSSTVIIVGVVASLFSVVIKIFMDYRRRKRGVY